MRPKTIAVIGGNSAAEVIRQCQAIGFDGDLWAVNPRRDELAGVPCVASLEDLPAVPDASFIAAPPVPTLDIIRELSDMGAPGAVCFAAGFAETGADGADLQRQLRDAAGDMAVIGPNSHGYLNYLDGVALWPDEHGSHRSEGGVALISQSGNIAINLTMNQRGLDIAYVVSVGNNSTLGVHDYIEALLLDSRVTAIGLHIEGINDVAAFSVAAIKALKQDVPIVALKAGRSKRGAEITRSHTGSLSGSDRLYSALFKRVGIARCDTVSQFLETLKFLSVLGPLGDDTFSSMSCSGGEASLVADCAERLGLRAPQFNEHAIEKMQVLLGENVSVSNPLDYHLYAWGDYERLQASFAEVLKHEFACSVLVLDYPPGEGANTENWEITERALSDAVTETGQRAVIVSSLPETLPKNVRDRLNHAGIAPMQGIEDCLYAMRAASIVGNAQQKVDALVPVMAPIAIDEDVIALDEFNSKKALSRYGVKIPSSKLCDTSDVLNAADSLDYPLVLKAVSPELSHKTEAGAVAINLSSREAITDALEKMGANFDQFLVEEMITSVVAEIIIGVSRDETFGLTLMIGAGGTLVELLDDTVSLLLPLQKGDVEDSIAGLKVSKIIDGYRGQVAGSKGALIETAEAIGAYACDHGGSLQELDVNPLLVLNDRVVAVDAYIRKTNTHQDEK